MYQRNLFLSAHDNEGGLLNKTSESSTEVAAEVTEKRLRLNPTSATLDFSCVGRSSEVLTSMSLVSLDEKLVSTSRFLLPSQSLMFVIAVAVATDVLELSEVWPYVSPSDYVMAVVAEFSRIAQLSESRPTEGNEARAAFIEALEHDESVQPELNTSRRRELEVFFPSIHAASGAQISAQLKGLQCPKMNLFAATLSLNLRDLASDILRRLKQDCNSFPIERVKSVRKAYGSLLE